MAFTTLATTQKTFLESHLRGTGVAMSSAQASATYGIKNLRAVVSTMRQAGINVRKHTNTRGKTAYSMSRRDVFGFQGKIYN